MNAPRATAQRRNSTGNHALRPEDALAMSAAECVLLPRGNTSELAPWLHLSARNQESVMSNIITLAADELAEVSGGHTPGQAAQEPVGSDWRCHYVKQHLGRLGADAAFMNRSPRINRNVARFSDSDLKDRLQMEHFYNCRNAQPVE
jgi:hypothetical protein